MERKVGLGKRCIGKEDVEGEKGKEYVRRG